MDLYFTRTQNIETIPPTKNALFLHTKRALYQSGIWSKCLEAIQNLPSLKDFGWKDSGELLVKWVPHWTTENVGNLLSVLVQQYVVQVQDAHVRVLISNVPFCTNVNALIS